MCLLMKGSLIAFIPPSVSHKLVVWDRYCSPCTLVSYLKCSNVICRQYMHMLYLSFKPDNSLMEQDAMKIMERFIHDIRIWMLTDQLKLNDDKTEFMVIGTRHQLGKVSASELSIGYSKVVPVRTAKNLGVWLDTHLKLDTRITKMCNAAYYHLHNIWRIWKYIYGLPKIQIDKLQRVQNVAARLIPTICVIVTSCQYCMSYIGYHIILSYY